MRVVRLVYQQSQPSVWASLLERFEADSREVGDEMRELLLKVLALVGNCFATM